MNKFWEAFYKRASEDNKKVPEVLERSMSLAGPRLAEITEKADSNEFPVFKE